MTKYALYSEKTGSIVDIVESYKYAQKQHPKAHYHIYDNDPDGYRCKMKDRKKYWR